MLPFPYVRSNLGMWEVLYDNIGYYVKDIICLLLMMHDDAYNLDIMYVHMTTNGDP